MPPAVPPRSFSRCVLLLLALAPAGCGLTDYENKMQVAEDRLKRFDDENKLLGDPLVLPAGDAPPLADVFVRPPKGVEKNPTDPKEAPLHYPAKNAVCTDLYLWIGAKDDDKESLKKKVGNWLSSAAGTWQPFTVQPPNGRPAVAFESAQFAPANAPAFRVYLHPTPNGVPVAVVYKVAQPSPAGADDAIKMSLETYADSSAEVLKARGDYAKWRGH